ncbi:MAG: HAMP domain-containing protein [Akkermansiaceae bacterium]|nr:HAMP domain-containing protein [Armatimonadota bacterium]
MARFFSFPKRPRKEPSALLPSNPLRRLQWQLTLSYMGITALVTLIAELIFILLWSADIFTTDNLLIETATDIQKEVRTHVDLFRRKPYPVAELQRLLDYETIARRVTARFNAEIGLEGGNDLLCITDPQGKVIVRQTNPRQPKIAAGVSLRERLPGDEAELLARALRGENASGRMAKRTVSGSLAAAVPIMAGDSPPVLGVVYYRSTPLRELPFAIGVVLLPQLIIITFFSCVVGFIVGAVTARRVSKHVGGIALAADAWARGDLQATAPDTGGDELSLLARRLNRMAQELGDLFALRREVATVQERHRLARDLHDTVKQQVFAAGLQIATARALASQSPQASLAPLMEAENLVRQAQTELTDLLRELRPLPGDGRHLPGRLQKEIADWSRRTGIAGEFLSSELFPLSERHATELLRIVQEALANSARHSGATTVRVFLNGHRATGEVTLSISDNGRGFDSGRTKRRSGLGLSNMRERAEGLPGGGFALQSTPGAGTRIEVRYVAPSEGDAS